MNVSISAVLPNDTPKTLLELVRAAILARTYIASGGTTAERMRSEAASRVTGSGSGDVFVLPTADVYIMDAYKGVSAGGVADAAVFTLPDDFTDAPGGGAKLAADTSRRYTFSDLGSRVAYQNSGGDVIIYFDLVGQ